LYGNNKNFLLIIIYKSETIQVQAEDEEINNKKKNNNNNENTNESFDFQESEISSVKELNFAFKRASSRLIEMCSVEYLRKWKSIYILNNEEK
jgi:predicted ATPase